MEEQEYTWADVLASSLPAAPLEADGERCFVCLYASIGVGDFDDTVARCSEHDAGPFCGPCFDLHAVETGCGND